MTIDQPDEVAALHPDRMDQQGDGSSPRAGSRAPRTVVPVDEAVRMLRADPRYRSLVRDAYLGRDVREAAGRYSTSAEWAAVKKILGNRISGATVVDLGAGTGITSIAFAAAGAAKVYVVEPDPSDEVGRGAIARQGPPPELEVIGSFGEGIPLPDAIADIVFCRQVLHHATDLDMMIAEVARVLRYGGLFIACREHVVDDAAQLEIFLAGHPIHRIAGGEHAYALPAYRAAIARAGLQLVSELGPWDTVINAFPTVRSQRALRRYPRTWLARRYGLIGRVMGHVGPARRWAWGRIRRPTPGRLYTFVAVRDRLDGS